MKSGKSPKIFTKVEGKKNLYKNNNPLINFPLNKEIIKDTEKNKSINKSETEQQKLDFINKSYIIKGAVAHSNLRKLKKNLTNKNINDTTELYNTFSQRNDNIDKFKDIMMDYEIKKGKNYKKINYDIKKINSNDNKFNFSQSNNNNYKSNTSKNKKENFFIEYEITRNINDINNENYSKLNNYNLSKSNNNILIMEEGDTEITERKKYYSIEKFFKKNKKNNIISELLLRNKKKNKNSQITFNNSFLNISVNQIRESPFFEKIKIPEKGHSKGIIEMIKNFKDTSVNNPKIEKYVEKNKIEGKDKKKYNNKDINNNRRKNLDNNINKKTIKCLNDQKVFDEPKNKTNFNNRNFSYKKKILKNRNNSTNKKISLRKGINKLNKDNAINSDKNFSFNNNFEIKMPALAKKEEFQKNKKSDEKEEPFDNIFFKKDNFLYKKYTSNKNKKKNSFYKKIKNTNSINIKINSSNNYERNNSYSKMLNNYTNIEHSHNINVTRSESEKDNKNNMIRNTIYDSPMINSKIKMFRNQYLNDYLEEDFIFYKTLPNLKRARSNSSKNGQKIKEIQINIKNGNSEKEKKDENINNNTLPYFYGRDNLTFLKDSSMLPSEKDDKDIDLEFQQYNDSEIKKAILDINLDNQKKLMKTKSTNNFNKKNMLYFKPKNKQNKNLKSFYYSNFNSNNNSNIKKKNSLASPKIMNSGQNSPNSIKNLEFSLLNNTEGKEAETQRLINFKYNPKKQLDLNENENEKLFKTKLRKISLPKSNNKVYKKPINKAIISNLKISPKNIDMNIDSNCFSHKDEIIYVDKTYNPLYNKASLYKENFNSKVKDDFNTIFNSNKEERDYSIKIINRNFKNGFIKKFYNHYIKIPISKNNNYISKMNIFKFKRKKEINNKIKKPNISKCYLTKKYILKYIQEKTKEINIKKELDNSIDISSDHKSEELLEKNEIKHKKEINIENKSKSDKKENKNKINKPKKNKKSKKKKEEKEKNITNLENNKISLNLDSEIKENNSNEKEEQIETNNIKNDFIYLLNILTSKNILSIENQLTKLIITSNYAFNILNNENNAKLFLNDIIKNENIFIEVLMDKVISENKFNELYSKLCFDLYNKYLNSINEIIIMKFIDKNNNKDDYNIIEKLKIKLNENCISKFEDILNLEINDVNKQKLFYLIDFICQLLDYKIIEIETCLSIINKLFNQYDKNINNYYYLDILIYLILKLENINFEEKNTILKKITYIINNYDSTNDIPNYLKFRINEFNSLFNVKEKINNIENISQSQEYIFEGNSLLIKEDIEKYYDFLKTKEIDLKSKINENIEVQYDWPILKLLKKIDLFEIINDYINICIIILTNEYQISCCKSYIKNIIETMSYKLSLNKMRAFHNKILEMISNINNICKENEYMYEIVGNLLYFLIINDFCDIEDINIFINKDNESIISICKTIKYTILSSENINNYYDKFKNIDLFKNSDIFEKYITSELKDILNK